MVGVQPALFRVGPRAARLVTGVSDCIPNRFVGPVLWRAAPGRPVRYRVTVGAGRMDVKNEAGVPPTGRPPPEICGETRDSVAILQLLINVMLDR